MKWYEYMDRHTMERKWWTQRDFAGNCFEIVRPQLFTRFLLYKNEKFVRSFDTLKDAMDAAKQLMTEK